MFFCKTNKPTSDHHIIVAGEKLQIVSEFKYLGVLIDSNLSFKAHDKKTCNTTNFNIATFLFITNYLSTEAAEMFLHSMIFSHLNYCLTSWSQANLSTLKSLESQYKQAITILDKKPKLFHHCSILKSTGF